MVAGSNRRTRNLYINSVCLSGIRIALVSWFPGVFHNMGRAWPVFVCQLWAWHYNWSPDSPVCSTTCDIDSLAGVHLSAMSMHAIGLMILCMVWSTHVGIEPRAQPCSVCLSAIWASHWSPNSLVWSTACRGRAQPVCVSQLWAWHWSPNSLVWSTACRGRAQPVFQLWACPGVVNNMWEW